ncbi:DUF721 domain-containing protein [Zavarzinia sp. CC-PAN008]|uniref:DUF721 domain-containing protein n=1 Tax=Zavarzinia sp. CC-PAN008 TaxID=3243332 RepID=UPI003F7492E7
MSPVPPTAPRSPRTKAPKARAAAAPATRFQGPRPLGACVAPVIAPAARRQGFAQVELLSRWPAIVGERMGRSTAPVKLAWPRGREEGATLHIVATGTAALELQHSAGVLLERINAYLGFRAVERLAMAQGYAGRAPARPPRAAPSPASTAQAADLAAKVQPGPLRDALARLGAEVLQTESLHTRR